MLSLLASVALAQDTAVLLDGSPEFEEGCLEDDDAGEAGSCRDRFYRFLSQSMAEQGFTFQRHALMGSPVVNHDEGFHVGATLDTFPLSPPRSNLAGKEENTEFSPVLPRVEAAWLGAVGSARGGVGLSFLPPVPVNGASALIAGLDAGLAVGEGPLRAGLDAAFSFARARAPITATEEQYESGDFTNNLKAETYEAVCVPAGGCTDTFTVLDTTLQLGVSYRVASWLTPWLRVGGALVQERLYVMYDDTLWGLSGFQPQASGGFSSAPHDNVFLGAGAGIARRHEGITMDGEEPGLFFKLHGTAGYRF